jgi:two-component system, cell cycle response regulator
MADTDKMTIDFIKSNETIIRNLYDTLRVVDPEKKRVLLYSEGTFMEDERVCFSELYKKKVCENCISIRALKNKRTYMKIESVENKIYMISAVPLEIDNKTIVVELFKDVTDSLFYGSSINEQNYKVNNIITDMKKIATKDSLTGIYNRRYIDERLPIDMDRCISNSDPISIIMIDLDYFKNINDKFGHIAGDLVLKELAQCLKKCIRNKNDWIARYGGEEFLICIPGANDKLAYKLATRMHKYIRNKKIYYRKEKIRITASFGICTISDPKMTKEDFIDCADKRLYVAKNSGRNKIVVD